MARGLDSLVKDFSNWGALPSVAIALTTAIFSAMNWLLYVGLPLLLGLWAQWRVKSALNKYSQVRTISNLTGADVAQRILSLAGISDVTVNRVDGFLGDHYDPISKQIRLSSHVFDNPSVAAAGIAAHETGHAIQHARAYWPLQARMAVVPATQFASQILPFVIFGGLLFRISGLIMIGIICYAVLALFQLITLPVEFDASKRAKVILGQTGFVHPGAEAVGVNRVLDAAALTYVAAFIAAIGNLLYLLTLRRR